MSAGPDLRTPAERVAWIRERLGLSPDQLVHALARLPRRAWHGSRSSVYRYEGGRRPVDVGFARALSELSGYSLDWIYDGIGENQRVLDALERVRRALDAIEEQYRVDPIPPDVSRYERVDPPED